MFTGYPVVQTTDNPKVPFPFMYFLRHTDFPPSKYRIPWTRQASKQIGKLTSKEIETF